MSVATEPEDRSCKLLAPKGFEKPTFAGHKTLQNRGPEAPETHPDEAWGRPCEPRCSEEAPKSVQDAFRRHPRSSQNWLLGPQERPKASQERPSATPKRPNSTPELPKERFLVQRCMRKALEAIFCRFLRRARCWRSVFGPNKTVVLLHSEHVGSDSSPAPKHLEK